MPFDHGLAVATLARPPPPARVRDRSRRGRGTGMKSLGVLAVPPASMSSTRRSVMAMGDFHTTRQSPCAASSAPSGRARNDLPDMPASLEPTKERMNELKERMNE